MPTKATSASAALAGSLPLVPSCSLPHALAEANEVPVAAHHTLHVVVLQDVSLLVDRCLEDSHPYLIVRLQ